MQTYTIQKPGFMFGKYMSSGATVDLTDRQARLYLREKRIALIPAGAPQAAAAGRDRRATTGRRKKAAEAPGPTADDTPALTGSGGTPDGDEPGAS